VAPRTARADLLIVALLEDPGLLPAVEERTLQLRRLFARLGVGPLASRWLPHHSIFIAALRLGPDPLDLSDQIVRWCRDRPACDGHELLEAAETDLRALPTPSLTVAWDDRRARLVSSSGPFQALFATDGSGVRTWSSHAACAFGWKISCAARRSG
jgi:hypothetical protein